jgi:hypothetical protein
MANLRLPVKWVRHLAQTLSETPEEQRWTLETPLGNIVDVRRFQLTDQHGAHDVVEFTVNPDD